MPTTSGPSPIRSRTCRATRPETIRLPSAHGLVYAAGGRSVEVLTAADGTNVASEPFGPASGFAVVLDGTLTVGDHDSGTLARFVLPTAANTNRPAVGSLHPTRPA